MNLKLNNKKSKLPFVFSNFAITADGKIAFAGREFIPFGSSRDREHMLELRATADAVMSGARTVESRGVTLSPGSKKYQRIRLTNGLAEYNLRVIISGSGSINPRADIFKYRFSPIIVVTSGRISIAQLAQLKRVADEVRIIGHEQVDLPAALRWLHDKWKVNRLLCEGGGALHGTMIRAGLIHEMHLTICPQIFGGTAAPTIADEGHTEQLAGAAQFKLTAMKRIGDELFVVYHKAKTGHF